MLSYSDIKKLDDKACQKKMDEMRRELFELNMSKQTSGVQKPHRYQELRSSLARVKTFLASKKGKA